MSRAVYGTATALLLLGAATFLYKIIFLEMPTRPDRDSRVWRVEIAITATGEGRRGQIELHIPSSDAKQVLLDEQFLDDGLAASITERETGRRVSWRGRIQDSQELAYTFRVHLPPSDSELTPFEAPSSAPAEAAPDAARPRSIDDPVISAVADRLGIPEMDEPEAVLATAFGFVAHEIESVVGGSENPRLVARAREGNETGKSRLLVELLRIGGIEAHLGSGLRLVGSGPTELTRFVEARLGSTWIPMMTSAESPRQFPRRFLVLVRGDRPLVSTTHVTASHLSLQVLRESLPPEEIAAFVAPASPFWRYLSLYRLPVKTQSTLNVLLLMPLAALVASIFRNLIGLRTFGTFMPILIALSLRNTDLSSGLVLITSVLLAGVVGRILLDRLRLLFVPRICLLLCMVILFVTALAQIGYEFGGNELMTGLLFPIVILAMLIERISVTALEEGTRSTAILLAGSLILSALAYPIFQSSQLTYLFFGFPELILCVMGALVLLGGYTGYRVSELWRFRSLMLPDDEVAR
jgi:hypothetical protein